MATVELVIKIPEEKYNQIINFYREWNVKPKDYEIAIINGTPLPKGHGRIIDVNDLLDRIGLEDNDSNREDNVGEIITLEDFDFIPTIIDADTESEGE